MFHFKEAITNTKGDALIGYFVRLADTSDDSGIDIFADSSSTPIISVSGLADACKVDTDGMADFWVPSGTYHMDIYATDGATLVRRETLMQFGVPAGDYGDVTVADGDAWTVDAVNGTTPTSIGIAVLGAADQAAARTAIGAGVGGGDLVAANNLSDLANAGTARGNLGLGTAATLASDTDTTLSANSDSKIATQKATKAYVDSKSGPGTTGQSWTPAGSGQTVTGVWDFAVDGAKSNVDFAGLAAFNELLIVMMAVTGSGTNNSGRTVRVSTDNGVSFYSTSGDYKQLAASGIATNAGAAAFLSGSTGSAVHFVVQIRNTKGAAKMCLCDNGNVLFTASASDINAVRITTNSSDTLNGGKIYVYGR